ncbi:solute carrier family 35 member C2-like isoform X2 [Clavelina lepadiformis]|uniref:solute carrier family 35 member C2-like isoform X2 n=1 Tax=Clavelina lepadiformis TaxID=159417 RepID=UPI004041A3C8
MGLRKLNDGQINISGSTNHVISRAKHADKSRCCQSMLNCKLSQVLRTIFLVLFYYVFSIGLTFYNKWMFKGFHFPLITTCVHFISVFVLSGLCRLIFMKCRETTITLDWDTYLKKVFITGIASALDIGLSNWSFVFITVSLYTMVKSSCVVFILGFALLFKLEKPRFSLVFVVCLIASGLFMFVYKSSQFNLEGFILVLVASFLGGIRWTLSQILTQKKELGLGNPIDLLYHLQPTMFIGLFPLALAHEGLSFFTSKHIFAGESISDVMPTIVMIAVGGLLAFLLSFSEYLLLTNTSSLTLSICGIFKEILTLVLATTYNNNHLSLINWFGFFVCLSGICLHVLLKFWKRNEVENDEQIQMNLLQGIPGSSDSDSETELFNIQRR